MARSVLVTGASSGIGLLTCLELAAHGWDVVGTARTADKAERLARAAGERGVPVRTLLLDVDDAASCADAVAEAQQMTGGLYGLVNNAGYVQAGAVEDVSDELARAQLETNLLAPVRLARLVLPAMRARGSGRIVNVSSVVGRLTTPMVGWYAASKHGLEAVSDALRMEVAGDGVQVALVEPGMFATDVWTAAQSGHYPAPTTPRYARAYARSGSLADRSDKLPDPVWVARAVRLALSSPVPLARYVVGFDAAAGIAAQTFLPTTLTDWVKKAGTGLRSRSRERS